MTRGVLQVRFPQPLAAGCDRDLVQLPQEIKPLSRAPVNLKMSNDTRIIFDTIGKLAGLTVIYTLHQRISQTRDRTHLCVTERLCTYTPQHGARRTAGR